MNKYFNEQVFYWTESFAINNEYFPITCATTSVGLCWLGIGENSQEQELKKWCSKRIPKADLIRQREVNEQVLSELKEYFTNQRKVFSIPLHIIGTEFQMRVWNELLCIPYGETRAYSEIAERVNCPRGYRAIGMANNKNPIGIIVPCHRVIGKDGSLTGYGGGINLKQVLLSLEQDSLRSIKN